MSTSLATPDDAKYHFLTGSFRFLRRTINFSPDQVSSIAHTFTSTNPSGSATARTTSSVTSVGTPDDLFGQETQTVPVSAIFSRKADNRLLQFAALLDKNVDKTRIGLQAIGKSYAFGNCTEQSTIVCRRVDCDDGQARFDSELLW